MRYDSQDPILVPDKVMQAILRPEDVKTTQRSYIKTVPSMVTEAMKQLEGKIGCAAGFGELICKLLKTLEPRAGVEPATCRLRIGCSTTELPRPFGHKALVSSRRQQTWVVHACFNRLSYWP